MNIVINEIQLPNGNILTNVPADMNTLRELGVSESDAMNMINAVSNVSKKMRNSQHMRDKIKHSAGDMETLLGTTADASQLLLFEVGNLADLLSKATTIDEVNSAAQPLATLLNGFCEQVKANTVRLPYQSKGIADVIPEIETRATAVNDILFPSNNGS